MSTPSPTGPAAPSDPPSNGSSAGSSAGSAAASPKRNRWAEAAERRLTPRSWFGGVFRQWPLVVSLAIVVAGLIVVAEDHFLRGTVLIAGGICTALVLRAILPSLRAGVLKVRSRILDLLTLAFFGVGTLVAALVVPPPG